MGLLIEDGTKLPNGDKLDWSTKIKDVLPEWKLQDQYASDDVDIWDLTVHWTGLPVHLFARWWVIIAVVQADESVKKSRPRRYHGCDI